MTELSPGATTPRFESLLVVRLSSMGDIIHTLPAVAALREAFPHATLGWLIEERWAELLCTLRYPRSGRRSGERPLADRVHTVNLAEWRHNLFSFNTLQQITSGLSEIHGIKYDAAIDFQGAVRSALLAKWSGASTVFGEAQPRENAASMFYTRQVETDGRHVVEQALDLARAFIGRKSSQRGVSVRPGCGKQNCFSDRKLGRVRDFESRRGLGREAMAGRALRSNCKGARS